MANELTIGNTTANPIVQVLRGDKMKAMVEERLGKRAGQFTTSLISLVNANKNIAECTPMTVIQAALTAASMDLPINQNLGFAYIVPYKNSKPVVDDQGRTQWVKVAEAQFQMGWKGFVQLAQRSGKFKLINTTEVREGEVKSRDRMTGELVFDWIEDDAERNKKPVIGYLAYFELLNGFRKSLYMTKAEVDAHANRYSQAYKGSKNNTNRTKHETPWTTDFDLMAQKTAIKLLLSKYAPLSTEMQEAINVDQSVDDGSGRRYIDNDDVAEVGASEDQKNAIVNAHTEGSDNADEPKDDEPDNGTVDSGVSKPASKPSGAGVDAEKTEDGKKVVPKKSVKEKAAEWAKKGVEANHKGEQATLVDDENTGQDT